MNSASVCHVVGTTQIRSDAVEKVTGTGKFTFDVAFPNMLHGKILRSPYPHARIRSIDTSGAREMLGVAAVVTGADLAGLNPLYGCEIKDQPVLAIEKIRYEGDSVAAVAAVDEQTAYAALERIVVDYEELSSLMTMDDALALNAPLLFEETVSGPPDPMGEGAFLEYEPGPNLLCRYELNRGDIASAFERVDHVFEDEFKFSRMNQFHLEPHVTVAQRIGDGVEIWSCNQDPFVLRNEIAHIFKIREHQIRIHTNYVGGGFGGKSFCKMEPLAVLLAFQVDQPVRLCLSLDECIVTTSQHAAVLKIRTGVMADGTLVVRDSHVDMNAGAYADASPMISVKLGYRVPGPYRWEAIHSTVRCVRTTNVPGGSFRGFGGTQASWASESQIDMIARRLGIDPYKMRMHNLLSLDEPYMPGESGFDSDLRAGLTAVADRLGYHRRKKIRGRGMGLSVGFKDAGGVGRSGHALVKVTTGGDIFVHAGCVEIGQGTNTAMNMIAAEVLGAPLSSVKFVEIDSNHTPLDQGTRGSCSLTVVGNAVISAAEDARRQILDCCAKNIGRPVEELQLDDWTILHGDDRYPVGPIMLREFGQHGFEFVGQGIFRVAHEPGTALNAKTLIWMPSWCGAEVEVDEDTGTITVHKLVVGIDAGRAINPLACRGQVEGAALQGLGQVFFEGLVYEGDSLITAQPLTYRVPCSTDLPIIFESLVFEQGHGAGPFGAKGIGEGGILGVASAIANAVEDAIGVRLTELPFWSERVWAALDAERGQSG